jgi:hypothetical protein
LQLNAYSIHVNGHFIVHRNGKGAFGNVTRVSGRKLKIDRARRIIALCDQIQQRIKGIKWVKNICQLEIRNIAKIRNIILT